MSAAKPEHTPPEVIAGRYKIETRLGQGGMGSVWKAMHLSLRSPVAVKLIDPALASSEEAVARFLREAQSAAALRSPHVVQILDHGVDAGVPYIAMELLDGESLAERLARMRVLSPAETARVMTHIARAMARAHEAGIVHRDLKPANVFVVRNDDEEIAKVLDFGIAKATTNAFDVTTGTRTGEMLGTPYYMSPEQVEGQKALDHRTDLWAMAVMTYECLVGVRPFESDTLGSLLLQICSKPIPVPSQRGSVPEGFDTWFERATRRAPEERFQSAREQVEALRAVLVPSAPVAVALATPKGALERPAAVQVARPEDVGREPHVSPPSLVRPSAVPGLRRPMRTWLWVALLSVVLVMVAAFLWDRPQARPAQAAARPLALPEPHVVSPAPAPAAEAQPSLPEATAAPLAAPPDLPAEAPARAKSEPPASVRAPLVRAAARPRKELSPAPKPASAPSPPAPARGDKPDLGF